MQFLLRTEKRYNGALPASIRIFQQATGIGLATVMKDKLPPGQTIESHAAAFFEEHDLGKGFQDKARLWLWSEAEHQFKIEVSYSLEAAFPDLLCHQLEQSARGNMQASNPYARLDLFNRADGDDAPSLPGGACSRYVDRSDRHNLDQRLCPVGAFVGWGRHGGA